MNDNLVFHYCDVSTALLILKNKQIWMTSIRNLNDGNESIGVYKLFFDLLEKYDSEKCLNPMIEYSRRPGVIQLYEKPLGAYPEYVACFSKNPDSISQWIAYADNGQGIAIGFDETEFINITSESALQYRSVSYIRDEDIQQHIPYIYKHLKSNIHVSKSDMMDIAMEQIKRIYPLGIDHKTMHYESECERRIIYDNYPEEIKNLPNGWKIEKIDTYAKKNLINTYIPLCFPKEVIRKIITGPKYQKNYYEVEGAMEALGYTEVEICNSTSNYR